MPLTLANLVADYKASLNDAASVWPDAGDAAFVRHLQTAAQVLAERKRSRTLVGDFTAVADQVAYTDVPADLLLPKAPLWGNAVSVWDRPPGPLPMLSKGHAADGSPALLLTPAPTAAQISVYGSTYRFYYFAQHELSDTVCTFADRDGPLLILRAQVEAMRELMLRNYTKPVSMRAASGIAGGQPRNAQPSHMYEVLLAEFERSP